MSKIILLDELISIGHALNLPDFEALKTKIEAAADEMASAVANKLDIKFEPSSWEGKEFAGLATTFRPSFEGQECPKLIHENDESGDWE